MDGLCSEVAELEAASEWAKGTCGKGRVLSELERSLFLLPCSLVRLCAGTATTWADNSHPDTIADKASLCNIDDDVTDERHGVKVRDKGEGRFGAGVEVTSLMPTCDPNVAHDVVGKLTVDTSHSSAHTTDFSMM